MANIRDFSAPVEGRIIVNDTEVGGLMCRVSSTGSKSFYVYSKVNGRPERILIGRFPKVTVEEARKRAKVINGSIVQGVNPAEIKRGQKEETTFHDLFMQYLERHAKDKKNRWKADKGTYELYWKKNLANKRLSEIERANLAEVHSSILFQVKNPNAPESKKKYKSNATANRALALVSSVYGWGINMGLCKDNPAHGIKRFSEKSRDRFLQEDEMPRFFVAMQEVDSNIRDFIFLALLTGARRSNVLSMQWSHISFERREWRIPLTKNQEPLVIPLCSQAIKILLNRKQENELFVFPSTGKTGHLVDVKKSWNKVREEAGLVNFRFHDLRRTLGSWQAKTGASLIVIGKSLGHKSVQSTAIYSRLDLKPVRDSVDKATNAIIAAFKIKKNESSVVGIAFNAVAKKDHFSWMRNAK